MRAVIAREPGGPEVLEVVETETPEAGEGEVLVKVIAAGVNRADLLQRQGNYAPPPGATPILGLECSGTVAAVGAGVEDWSVGAECVALLSGGGYAEYVAVPAGQIIPPPRGIDLITAGGLVEVAATVGSNLATAALASGETFLVHGGSGGVGSFAIQYAKELGTTVIATAGTSAKREHCLALGADHALDYHDDWVAELRRITDGVGADVILDVVGAAYLEPNLNALAADGRIVVIGLQGGTKGTLHLGKLLAKRGQVIATALRARPVAQKSAICARVKERIWPLFRDQRVVPAPERRFALAEVADAHALLESGDSLGKLVLVI
ncbi:MAG: NAD(P)H-quinone oxidoreductase [Propionibacteriaceae bacterium]